jgi:hypothetical protein
MAMAMAMPIMEITIQKSISLSLMKVLFTKKEES